MSDGTHLSNFAGDKKEWPIYMTIGNLSSKTRQSPSTHSVVLVGLLPIPLKMRNISDKRKDEQRQTNREVLNEVLRRVLQPLTFPENPSADSGYYNVLCADGNYRRCKPLLAAWLADCPEYSDLHHLQRGVCYWCECPKTDMGDYVPPEKPHPPRDHNLYRTLSDANTTAANAELKSRHVHQGFNVFRHIPCVVSDLPKPDLLHTMQIGMLEHLQKWLSNFMKTHDRLDRYNAIWLSVPAYHDLTPKNKSYDEVGQWTGKEMKEMSRYLLGVVTQSLRGGTPAQRPLFNRVIECTRALLEFYMYARYDSHDEDTLSYMDDALRRFHLYKDVFLLGRVTKKSAAKSRALRTELIKKRKAEEEDEEAAYWTPSKRQREKNAWRDYINHEVELSKEGDAHFNFPKIHLMSHWVDQIRRYGTLKQYSAETHELAHKANLKDGWNASNRNLNYLPQVITFQRRILCFEMRDLNLKALARRRENTAGACKEIDPDPPPYAKPEFMGPQKRQDGNHPDAMIKDFRGLLESTQDPTQRAAIYNGTREFLKHKSVNKTYISDERLHAMELCIYHGIKVQVENLNGKRTSQMCRCTGNQSWRGGDKRNDWVWVKQRPGRCYGALNGRLPWQLQRLFKVKLLNDEGNSVEYWLALALTTVPENSGNLDPVSKFVQVRKAPAAVALQVFSVGNIVGCAHVIPEKPATKKGDGHGGNEKWIVNSHIDLATWNDVYS